MTLYIIRALKTNLVKVGISDTFDARLSKLRRENADEIEVLRVFHGDADTIMELERSLHQELSSVNAHHEWFEDCPQVRGAIEDLDKRFNPENYVESMTCDSGRTITIC